MHWLKPGDVLGFVTLRYVVLSPALWPMELLPSRKVTVPEANVPLLRTVAVNVTACMKVVDVPFVEEETVVVVLA